MDYHSLFNYLLIKKHFCCFQFLAIANKTADKYSWTVLHNNYSCANTHFDFFGIKDQECNRLDDK